MQLQINIRNIRVNSINTLGSLNVGKVMLADNRAASVQLPKEFYEEFEENEENLMDHKYKKTIKQFADEVSKSLLSPPC
ncbi:hypothetical protein [Bacillus sp. B15-48]|uniref:hypothetical protein n=1 Tax=Bacillus sp. B15-48 TaxID=1548601 RepID=UPI00193FCFB5|nr:hypothetical protein [Bacillus sp. B15-48]MBM4765218.1 hypothetical protein [Bacillus sp. B15-48]